MTAEGLNAARDSKMERCSSEVPGGVSMMR